MKDTELIFRLPRLFFLSSPSFRLVDDTLSMRSVSCHPLRLICFDFFSPRSALMEVVMYSEYLVITAHVPIRGSTLYSTRQNLKIESTDLRIPQTKDYPVARLGSVPQSTVNKPKSVSEDCPWLCRLVCAMCDAAVWSSMHACIDGPNATWLYKTSISKYWRQCIMSVQWRLTIMMLWNPCWH